MKYHVHNFSWGYHLASFATLAEAKRWIAARGMRCDHKRGETVLFAAI